jgi:hypothetical protein
MIHHRQRLALRLETGHDLSSVHARFDDLEGDTAADWFLLFGYIHKAATPFANLLAQFVVADARAGLLLRRERDSDCASVHSSLGWSLCRF